MPLHEYLESKRRANIHTLNVTGACHICGSTCRHSHGFNAAMLSLGTSSSCCVNRDTDDNGGSCWGDGSGNYNELSMVRPPNVAAMRVCACYGNSPTHDDHWPYSLRVCDRCIEDDAGIGRIRTCGVCGVVACDENCGPELLECTDTPEWNNAGCIECRRMGDFSEMEMFKNKRSSSCNTAAAAAAVVVEHQQPPQCSSAAAVVDVPPTRITRICTQCLEQSTPWVKYDFVCRRFRCQTRLVPSDVAERKRFRTFGTSPLNLLPEDGLVAIVDYLNGWDLKQLFMTSSAMCTVAERVAKEKVYRIRDYIPTGPIVIEKRIEQGNRQIRNWTHFLGTNNFSLRAPDDERAWVGVYHYVETIVRDMFYFGFQMMGENADAEVVGRFIHEQGGRSDNRGRDDNTNTFTLGRTYVKRENDLDECTIVGFSVRGGTILVTGDIPRSPNNLIVTSSRRLDTGIHRIICRLFCPGSGAVRGNRQNVENFKLGSIGILRTNQRGGGSGDGPTNSWAQRQDIMESWMKEEVVFGIEYNTQSRELTIISNPSVGRSSPYLTNHYTLDEAYGELYIAVELTAKLTGVAQSLLSVRNCNANEWSMFVKHTNEVTPSLPTRRGYVNDAVGANIFDRMEALEGVVNNARPAEPGGGGVGGDAQNPVRVRHQIFREAMRNRRDGGLEGNPEQRTHVMMAMEDRRRIGRFLLPRPAIPPMQAMPGVAQIMSLVVERDGSYSRSYRQVQERRFPP